MHPAMLQVGDRVRLRRPILWVASGSTGTIVLVYLTAPNLYDVHFDGQTAPRAVHGTDLELIGRIVNSGNDY